MSSRPAYSLVYALIYMVVILLVATTALENVEGKRLHMLDVEHTAQARITARSSSESAYIAAKNAELGYETSGARFWWMGDAPGEWDTELDATETGYERCIPENLLKVGDGCGKWKVMARAQKNKFDSTDSKLYTPIPNTGDAWDPDVCIKHFEVPRDADHPCNWNKIRYGEAVSIPLYYTDPVSGDTVTPFEDSGSWYLRMRTPCKPDDDGHPVAEGEGGADCDRYELDDGNGGLDENVSVVLWSLVGTNILEDTCEDPTDIGDGSSCEKEEETLFASPSFILGPTGQQIRNPALNTEITEKMVNDRKTQAFDFIDNVVLTSASDPALSVQAPFNTQGYEEVFNFMKEVVLSEPKDFDLLSLRVEVVNPLMNKDASEAPSVPNLEWQLVSDLLPSQAIASDKALLTGFGYERGHKGVYSYPFRKTWDRIREIIPNFTIAN